MKRDLVNKGKEKNNVYCVDLFMYLIGFIKNEIII